MATPCRTPCRLAGDEGLHRGIQPSNIAQLDNSDKQRVPRAQSKACNSASTQDPDPAMQQPDELHMQSANMTTSLCSTRIAVQVCMPINF